MTINQEEIDVINCTGGEKYEQAPACLSLSLGDHSQFFLGIICPRPSFLCSATFPSSHSTSAEEQRVYSAVLFHLVRTCGRQRLSHRVHSCRCAPADCLDQLFKKTALPSLPLRNQIPVSSAGRLWMSHAQMLRSHAQAFCHRWKKHNGWRYFWHHSESRSSDLPDFEMMCFIQRGQSYNSRFYSAALLESHPSGLLQQKLFILRTQMEILCFSLGSRHLDFCPRLNLKIWNFNKVGGKKICNSAQVSQISFFILGSVGSMKESLWDAIVLRKANTLDLTWLETADVCIRLYLST